MLREANSADNKYAGHFIQRGQLFRDYMTIREDLAWFVGYRKEKYSENQMKKAMKFLRQTKRISTAKALGGVLITICNYDYYQNPKNYERTNGRTNGSTNAKPLENQTLSDNNKNNKNNKNGKKKIEERKQIFANSLQSYIDMYGESMINDFCSYWTEHGENDQKMRFEKETSFGLERRLKTWKRKQSDYGTYKRSINKGFKSDATGGAIARVLADLAK